MDGYGHSEMKMKSRPNFTHEAAEARYHQIQSFT